MSWKLAKKRKIKTKRKIGRLTLPKFTAGPPKSLFLITRACFFQGLLGVSKVRIQNFNQRPRSSTRKEGHENPQLSSLKIVEQNLGPLDLLASTACCKLFKTILSEKNECKHERLRPLCVLNGADPEKGNLKGPEQKLSRPIKTPQVLRNENLRVKTVVIKRTSPPFLLRACREAPNSATVITDWTTDTAGNVLLSWIICPATNQSSVKRASQVLLKELRS